ncbi:Hypothetical predicted protein [Mytilus galloprovincialis]|uniref:Ig-like domain-containing protein n=1 Tax=Mytilus galloprovincialis TaxID=29158 RepID=A0A8B6GWE7_MYTGA|nr:Hypothetical predicted protein [Mytilus galloprovincialis]
MVKYQVIFIVIVFQQITAYDCIHVHISVNLKFPKKIQLGKELKLDCESSNAIPSHRSRQWRGGSDNQLLCYDGTTVDSTKYIEKRISSRRYELIVEETSENDLQCPYACRVGFDIDQKFLEVNEHNFLHMPEENFTEIDKMQNGNYRLVLTQNRVYPKPVCNLNFKGARSSMNVTKESKSHVLHNVTYGFEFTELLFPCGNKIEIECQAGNEKYLIFTENSIACYNLQNNPEGKTPSSIVVWCVVCGTIGLVVVSLILYKTRRMNKIGDKDTQAKKMLMEIKNVNQEAA